MARIGGRRERIRTVRAARQQVRQERRQVRQAERAIAKEERREARDDRREDRREGQRRRRNPEEARVEILDAAERVFVEFAPDQVGLKEVAREAGVSHALITHYFGTYAGMIEAVLERRIRTLREAMLAKLRETGALERPNELLAMLFRGLADPIHLRLTRWMLASERPSAAHAFALRDHGLQLVAHQVASALLPQPTREQISTVELTLLAAVASAYGYALGKYSLAGALGRPPTAELDDAVLGTLGHMVESHIRSELGVTLRR